MDLVSHTMASLLFNQIAQHGGLL